MNGLFYEGHEPQGDHNFSFMVYDTYNTPASYNT